MVRLSHITALFLLVNLLSDYFSLVSYVPFSQLGTINTLHECVILFPRRARGIVNLNTTYGIVNANNVTLLENNTVENALSPEQVTKSKRSRRSKDKSKDAYKYDRFITIPTTPYKNYGDDPIQYYPWNDGIDYNELCKKVLARVTQNGTYYVISNSFPGGLGHKYTSIVHTLTYALLSGRRFLMAAPDAFWSELNSCIRELRYTGPLSQFRQCGKTSHCININIANLTAASRKENLIFRDYRFKLFTNRNLRLMRGLGILRENQHWNNYRRMMLRLLLNPNPDNIRLIQERWSLMGSTPFNLSVHIRCGGLLADYQEHVAMISERQLPGVAVFIKKRIQKQHIPEEITPSIYLSTDSTKAEQYIRSSLQSYHVYSFNNTRGHSTSGSFSSLHSTIVDLFMLCKSERFLGTRRSSFSQIAVDLCKFVSFSYLPVSRKYVSLPGKS